MAKTGKSLEALVAAIEQALGSSSHIKIERNKRLIDKKTGQLREHDVVLTANHAHHAVVIAIECRDRSRPTTVNDVESFRGKCEDTGVNQGIIVSSSGFRNTARKKAEQSDIRCLDIQEASSFHWLAAPGMVFITRHVHETSWTLFPEKDGIVTKDNVEILDRNGTPISASIFNENVARYIQEQVSPTAPAVDRGEMKFSFLGGDVILRNNVTGISTGLKRADVLCVYSVFHELKPFSLQQYRDKAKDALISDVASASVEHELLTGRFVLVNKADDGTTLMFVPGNKKIPKASSDGA